MTWWNPFSSTRPPPAAAIAIAADSTPTVNITAHSDLETAASSRPVSPPRPSSSPLRDDAPITTIVAIFPHKQPLLPPTSKLTSAQFIYLFVLDGLGALILSGGINFAIAYAMYTAPQYTTGHPPDKITLWSFPSTLAGDAAVTIILQCLVTWLIELFLVNRDLKTGGVAPVGFLPPWLVDNKAVRWFLSLPPASSSSPPPPPSEKGVTVVSSPGRISPYPGTGSGVLGWASFLFGQAAKSMVVAVVSFLIFWGPTVGLLIAAGRSNGRGDWEYDVTWTPQLFKLILGGVLGLVTTPVMAGVWLVRAGWVMGDNDESEQ
ncbi:hypothetical protein QBC36DRAFT_356861 [Triangularia setosa]|uniref:Uncharacterized protein n=1 Tax=Triangularia setosa TaxID=2587417 RepID=A0AAN6WE05_9PEZI|nr:hypothetical protein QBC36DRAFT_356861 [Podospora setosa]